MADRSGPGMTYYLAWILITCIVIAIIILAFLTSKAIAKSATGPQGTAGPKGCAGGAGPSGPTGSSGAAGTATNTGATGPTGDTGGSGPTGTIGPTGSNSLTYVELLDQTFVFSGPWASTENCSISFVRVGRAVTMNMDSLAGTWTNASAITSSTAIPTNLLPITSDNDSYPIYLVGPGTLGLVTINPTTGIMTISQDNNSINTPFTGPGGVGTHASGFSWVTGN